MKRLLVRLLALLGPIDTCPRCREPLETLSFLWAICLWCGRVYGRWLF
ncbi:MAG: hypothetical protein HYY16_07915 [Planctomycetes bacterium]|nr:hypothetical protein [Planctomycetota bacterium]